MDSRVSYMQSVEESFPHELASSVNPCMNLKDVFAAELIEPSYLKVYLRIRPLLPEEQDETKEEHIEILNEQSISVIESSNISYKNSTKRSHTFTFSHVYGKDSSQKVIFDETTDGLVKDVVSGQNCLMFTYGATNSGKTFTIQGTEKEPGLLPRTLVSLFKSIGPNQYLKEDLRPHHFCSVIRLSEEEIKKEREIKDTILRWKDFSRVSTCSNFSSISCSSKEFDQPSLATVDCSETAVFDCTQGSITTSPYFSVFVSFAEIYNEYVYDLLESIPTHRNTKRTPLLLGEDKSGSIYIKGLKHIKVCKAEEALQVLEVGRQNLHFASTELNQNSSRSHCIFTIKLVRLFDRSNPHMATTSMLSLCDLAGAERATKTFNSHDRLKEASNINTSLLVLGRCIAALRHNQSAKHSIVSKKMIPVPYRESKVTRLFQSFFMGNGLLSMIVNISTSNLLMEDTLKVLKFSTIVRKVAIIQNKNFADYQVEQKKVERSRFSRFMRQSLNMSKGAIRFSVPWANSTTKDVTFSAVMEEKDEVDSMKNETTYEEEDIHEELLHLIKILRDRLLQLAKENQEIEAKLRKEICDNFTQRIVEVEHSWRSRMEQERFRNEELMDWRVNKALETRDVPDSSRKRQRLNEVDEERTGSYLTTNNEINTQHILEERDLLKQELDAVKFTLKFTINSSKQRQEEHSILTFQLSKSLEEAEKEKEKAEMAIKSVLDGSQKIESAVIEKQQHEIDNLKEKLEKKDEEVNNVNNMLKDAAIEYIDNEQKTETLIQQNIMLSDQLNEAKQHIASHVTRLEERERIIYELQAEFKKSNMMAKTSKEQLKTVSESDEEYKCTVLQSMKKEAKNDSLIDFEKTEKKINIQHLKNEELNKVKYLNECVSRKDEECDKLNKQLKTALYKEINLLTQMESKENELIPLKDIQKQVEILQITNEKLIEENSNLKVMITNAETEEKVIEVVDTLSESLVNNEDLSKSGDAPPDNDHDCSTNREELDDLRLLLESLKLNTVQELEDALLKRQSQLEVMTKKFNESDEELIAMCKLNEALQNEVLTNRNKINCLESDFYGTKQTLISINNQHESLMLRYRRLSSESKKYEQTDKEVCELRKNLKEMKESISTMVSAAQDSKVREDTLTSKVESYTLQLRELATSRIQVTRLEENNLSLEEACMKFRESIQNLETSLGDKTDLTTNLTKKLESLDKKVIEMESCNDEKAHENDLVSKQLAAICEARKEELNKFESQIEEKDSEISALQKELKENIRGNKYTEVSNTQNVKQEDNVQVNEEQLRNSELERSTLTSYVSKLEKQLAEKSELCKQLETELCAISLNKKNDSTLECIGQNMQFVTPVPLARTTKGRSATKNRTMQSTELHEDVNVLKDVTRSTRSKRQMVTFSDSVEIQSRLQGALDSSSEDIPVVETSVRRSKRKPRGKSNKNYSVPNPHIQDGKDSKENQTVVGEKTENKRSTRKRRPLYNIADEQTFDGSPDLSNEPSQMFQQSPHSISRRQLRSKLK